MISGAKHPSIRLSTRCVRDRSGRTDRQADGWMLHSTHRLLRGYAVIIFIFFSLSPIESHKTARGSYIFTFQ